MGNSFLNGELLFWLTWIVIPLIVEIIPAIGNFFFLLIKYFKKDNSKDYDFKPEITIIIPVYNSSDTLEKCIRSIDESSYKNELMTIILVDNGSKDNSFEVFQKCQIIYPDLSMYWLTSNQGKSRALNKALFNSRGKYIINIDSDGRLEKDALYNIVKKFENDMELSCLTGVILTEIDEIEKTKGFFLRHIRRMEYVEYCHAFLAGRNFNSDANSLFTISGAFSAFRKSAIFKSYMYNTSTICEDAHMTFQIRNQKKRVALCNDAIFYVSPIDDMNKLYTQRQRWQIGELEVFSMFFKNRLRFSEVFRDPVFKTLLFDHTFAFPRMIWYFALIILSINHYSFSSVLNAMGLIYAMYTINGLLFYIVINLFLKKFPDDKKYYKSKVLYLLLYPIYNLYTFVLRFMGIINSITRGASWKTYTFKEEMNIVKDIFIDDITLGSLKGKKGNKDE